MITKGAGFSAMINYGNNVQIQNTNQTAAWQASTFRLGTGNSGGNIGGTHSFQGQIAEMAIWDKELSSQDRTDVFDHWNSKFALGL